MDELDDFSIEVLAKNFDLEALPDFELFKAVLIERISYLIKHDFEKLLWILYRIDVDENAVRGILSDKEIKAPTDKIADLIIERQLQKLKTRISYRKKDEDEKGDY